MLALFFRKKSFELEVNCSSKFCEFPAKKPLMENFIFYSVSVNPIFLILRAIYELLQKHFNKEIHHKIGMSNSLLVRKIFSGKIKLAFGI